MTFSIAARCPRSRAFGIAVTSSSICVASRCAWVAPWGAVQTQNVTDPQLGPFGLSLLEQGMGAHGTLQHLLDATRHGAWRQLGVVDRYGQVALASGARTLPTRGEATGEGCVALGNLLADAGVPQAMVDAFAASAGEALAERLMRALEAGLAAGGETGALHAAGLEVCDGFLWPVVDLRVDWHDAPIEVLRDLWTRYAPQQDAYLTRAIDPDNAPDF